MVAAINIMAIWICLIISVKPTANGGLVDAYAGFQTIIKSRKIPALLDFIISACKAG